MSAVEVLSRNWGWVVLRGLATLLFGVLAFVAPGLSLFGVMILFALYAVAEGLASVVAAINRALISEERWGSLLVSGVVSLLAGAIALIWPAMTALILVFIIALRAIVTGILDIMTAIRIRHVVTGEWMMALAGVMSILFGVVLIMQPGVGALGLIYVIGGWAVLFGALMVALGVKLRSLRPHQPASRYRPVMP